MEKMGRIDVERMRGIEVERMGETEMDKNRIVEGDLQAEAQINHFLFF